MSLLRAVGAYQCSKNKRSFCDENGVRKQGMVQVNKLRRQLTAVGEWVVDVTRCHVVFCSGDGCQGYQRYTTPESATGQDHTTDTAEWVM